MDLDVVFGNKKVPLRKRKRKPGRPKGSLTVNRKEPKQKKVTKKEQARLNKEFAFDWCYKNGFELVGLANKEFIFRDKYRPWLQYEKPYDEETPYIPSEIPVTRVKDY